MAQVPVPPDQVPEVAVPPIVPPIAAEVAPEQIADIAAPEFAVGTAFTVTVTGVLVAETQPATGAV